MDRCNITLLTLLDFSKAFDKVNHEILLTKLSRLYMFSTSATSFMKSYLSQRSQLVATQSSKSFILSVKRGVPQGSILGPLLFSLYVNDLPNILTKCDMHMYADDVELHVSCPVSQINECVRVCNSELDMVCKWAERNRLSLSPLKSKCTVIHNRSLNTDHMEKHSLNGQQLNYVDRASNLGFTINSTLSWSNHVNCTIGKMYGILRQLNDTKTFLSTKSLDRVAQSNNNLRAKISL